MINGQDWSSYQAAEPATNGLDFVFVKRTEGLDYVNPRASSQVAHARTAGLVIGHYHYPKISNSAATEADYFLRQLGSDLHPGDVLCLDWEWYGQKVSDAAARAYKGAFLARLRSRQPSHRAVLYCNRSDWTTVDTDSDCGDGLWIADPTTAGKPRVQHAWTFHQYSTAGGVDHDVANFGSAAALRSWAAGTTTNPEDDMPLTAADAKTILMTDGVIPAPAPPVASSDYATNKTWTPASVLASANQAAREANANTVAILAQLRTMAAQQGALSAAVTALTKGGGITAEQITAAAQAGAAAALAELGHTLTQNPTTNS